MKLFGGSKGARTGGAATRTAAKPAKHKLKPLAIVLACVLFIEACYFICVYSQNSFITKWRNIYISTAMETLSHQWLATAIIPDDIIQDVVGRREEAMQAQVDLESGWAEEEVETLPSVQEFVTDITTVSDQKADEEAQKASFYSLFYELDKDSFESYLAKHPEVLDNGWSQIKINEAGLDDDGTDIKTIHGEQILAVDVPNKILLIRIEGSGYRGVLAKGKDPSLLSLNESSQLGTAGQTVEYIAKRENGVLAMTGSGFIDPEGSGNGGILSGFAMCEGRAFGTHATKPGDKRLELHENNLMYIYDTSSPVGETCTDAVEWQPAVIIDGKDVVPYGWDGLQPRAIIGQSNKYEIMMLIIEGRAPWKGILGITLYDCADILLEHGCMQALNLDGGTSAIMWYDGENITHCSNTKTPEGRPMPTAFVYGAK